MVPFVLQGAALNIYLCNNTTKVAVPEEMPILPDTLSQQKNGWYSRELMI